MRLPGALSYFLFTLSLTKALPVHSLLTLTTDDFEKTVAEGYWFIEHFSPWCHHCREFKPTWEKLVDTAEKSDDLKHVRLAQVNCATHGDLCDAHGVTGYPQMNLYEKGQFVKTYKGAREHDLLTEFIKTNAPKPEPEPEPIRPPPPRINLEGNLVSLSESNYQSTLGQGPTFVKFFAPWCGHCKKLAPTWTQLARHMQGKMNIAEVNCDDHASLCSKEGVQGYPTLIYFNNGVRMEYNGGRNLEQLHDFAEKASAPPMLAIKTSEVEQRLSENEVVFLLVQTTRDEAAVHAVEHASSALFGTAPVYSVVSPTLLSEHKIDAPTGLLVFRSQVLSAYTKATTNLEPWLLAHSLPPALELAQDSFQRVMNAPHHPLVVIAAVTKTSKDQVATKMKEIGKKWLIRSKRSDSSKDVVFTWMDGDKWEKWMKNMYGISAVDGPSPSIVIAKHSELIYYDQDANGKPLQLSATRLFETLEALSEGKLTAKNSENRIERFARYTSKQLAWGEAYVVAHPLHAVAFILSCGGVVFWVLKKWLSVEDLDAEHGHGVGKKGTRLD